MAEKRAGGHAAFQTVPAENKAKGRARHSKRHRIGNCDYSMMFMVIFLVLFGLVTMYSASLYTEFYFSRQLEFALAGFVIMYIVSRLNYHYYKNWATIIFGFALIMVCLVRTPLAVELNGAARWIKIGPLRFQPSEIFKIAVIIFNAAVLSKLGAQIRKASLTWLFICLSLFEGVFVWRVTTNLSTGIIIGAIGIAMLFVARPNMKVFLLCAVMSVLLIAAIIFIAKKVEQTGTNIYWLNRIVKWVNADGSGANDDASQIQQALYAIGSGGILGKGLGNSIQKSILPEAMNDTVFAIICEELGFVGACFVIVLYVILLQRLLFIVRYAKERFGSFLALGILAHIAIQVILNIAVVTSLIPSTGITLPFISYGGTALVILLVEMGVALSVSRCIEFE